MRHALIANLRTRFALLWSQGKALAAVLSLCTLLLVEGPLVPEARAQDASAVADSATETAGSVFKGVGRRYSSIHVGIDLLVLSTPHYAASRVLFGSQYSLWGEWWPGDALGVKGMYASQKYPDLVNTSETHASTTLAFLGKYRFDTGSDWHFTVGGGLGSSDRTPPSRTADLKAASVLVTEMRAGMKTAEFLWLEGGVLIFDGHSGTGSSAERVGSTSYSLGLNFGF